jgi:hypothetical protein
MKPVLRVSFGSSHQTQKDGKKVVKIKKKFSNDYAEKKLRLVKN